MDDNAPLIVILTMIVIGLPVVLGIGSNILTRWMKHREVMAQALNAQTAEKAAQYAAHNERLEQRVRVLERIATDRGADLSDQIDQLRDERRLQS